MVFGAWPNGCPAGWHAHRETNRSRSAAADRLPRSRSIDGDPAALGHHGHGLGQVQLQHAVVVGGGDAGFVDAGDVEGAGEGAVAALAADVGALLVLLSWFSLCSAVMVRMPSFTSSLMSSLLKPGSSASRTNLSPASRMSVRKAGRLVLLLRKKFAGKVIKGIEHVVFAALKRKHAKHNNLSFDSDKMDGLAIDGYLFANNLGFPRLSSSFRGPRRPSYLVF